MQLTATYLSDYSRNRHAEHGKDCIQPHVPPRRQGIEEDIGTDPAQRFDQDANSILQVGSLDEYERAEVTAARLGVIGYIGRDYRVYYYIDYGYNGFEEGFKLQQDDEWSLYNLEVTFPKTRLGTFTMGRMK